jgi:hypothetical protein
MDVLIYTHQPRRRYLRLLFCVPGKVLALQPHWLVKSSAKVSSTGGFMYVLVSHFCNAILRHLVAHQPQNHYTLHWTNTSSRGSSGLWKPRRRRSTGWQPSGSVVRSAVRCIPARVVHVLAQGYARPGINAFGRGYNCCEYHSRSRVAAGAVLGQHARGGRAVHRLQQRMDSHGLRLFGVRCGACS